MDLPKSFVLPTGAAIPSIGFGTASVPEPSELVDAVKTAIDIGYRHIDGAWKYGVEEEVGLAIKDAKVPRSELFITTKFWPNFARNPELSLDLSLAAMKLDYVDLFLMHWPIALVPQGDLTRAVARDPSPEEAGIKLQESGRPFIDVEFTTSLVPMWRKMEELQRKGKAKAIGVSNCSISILEKLLPHVSPDTPLSANQVEAHPWFPNTELIRYCQSKGIIVEAYCPLGGTRDGRRRPVDDPAVKEIASRRGLEAGQLLQAWAVQRGTVPLGKSLNPVRMKGNLHVKRLTENEMLSLDALDLGGDKGRIVVEEDWGWPIFK